MLSFSSFRPQLPALQLHFSTSQLPFAAPRLPFPAARRDIALYVALALAFMVFIYQLIPAESALEQQTHVHFKEKTADVPVVVYRDRVVYAQHPHIPTLYPHDESVGLRKGTGARVVVVPALSLAYCVVAKAANTQIKRILMRANGNPWWNGNAGAAYDPRLSTLTDGHSLPVEFINSVMQDPQWTKLIVVRDPIERFFSAFLDKCVRGYAPAVINETIGGKHADSDMHCPVFHRTRRAHAGDVLSVIERMVQGDRLEREAQAAIATRMGAPLVNMSQAYISSLVRLRSQRDGEHRGLPGVNVHFRPQSTLCDLRMLHPVYDFVRYDEMLAFYASPKPATGKHTSSDASNSSISSGSVAMAGGRHTTLDDVLGRLVLRPELRPQWANHIPEPLTNDALRSYARFLLSPGRKSGHSSDVGASGPQVHHWTSATDVTARFKEAAAKAIGGFSANATSSTAAAVVNGSNLSAAAAATAAVIEEEDSTSCLDFSNRTGTIAAGELQLDPACAAAFLARLRRFYAADLEMFGF